MWAGRREFSLWAEVWGQVALSVREAGTMWWSLGATSRLTEHGLFPTSFEVKGARP